MKHYSNVQLDETVLRAKHPTLTGPGACARRAGGPEIPENSQPEDLTTTA